MARDTRRQVIRGFDDIGLSASWLHSRSSGVQADHRYQAYEPTFTGVPGIQPTIMGSYARFSRSYHGGGQAGLDLPESLAWLWRDYDADRSEQTYEQGQPNASNPYSASVSPTETRERSGAADSSHRRSDRYEGCIGHITRARAAPARRG